MKAANAHLLKNSILALLLYGLVFLVYTFPLVKEWNAQIIGLDTAFADTPQILSNLYWFKSGMESGELGFTRDVFYPFGSSLVLHGYTPGMGLLYYWSGWSAFTFLNTFILGCFLFSGLGSFRLAQSMKLNVAWSLLVGFVFAFSSFRLAQLQDHYWYVINFTLPWYLLYFPSIFRFSEGKGLPRIVSFKSLLICFLLGLMSASLDYYSTLFLIYLSGFYLLFRYVSRFSFPRWKPYQKWLLASLFLLGSSLLVDELRKAGIDNRHGLYWSGDVLGLLLPQNSAFYSSIWSGKMDLAWLQPGPEEKNLFLGLGLLMTLIWALVIYFREGSTGRNRRVFWALVFIVALCFPVLKVGGHTLLKLPTAFFHYVPFLNNLRVPTRWGMLLFLFLPLFIGLVLSKEGGFKTRILPYLLLILCAIEFKPNSYQLFPKNDSHQTLAKQIAELPGEVLLTFPFGVRDGYQMLGDFDTRELYKQTIHHKKLIGGYLSRVSDSLFVQYEQDPLCRDLFRFFKGNELVLDQQDYSRFFRNFSPDILWIREDYRNTAVQAFFTKVAREYGYALVRVDEGLYRIVADTEEVKNNPKGFSLRVSGISRNKNF